MTNFEQVEELKNAASMLAMFKASTEGIDAVISEISGEEFHTPKQYSDENTGDSIGHGQQEVSNIAS